MNLFHYTDITAVKSILEKKEIWLTDFRFLNDSRELQEGFSVLNKMIDPLLDKNTDKARVLNFIKSNLFKGDDFNPRLEPVYIFSLSRKNDSLSQWRAYGSYSVEFDSGLLKDSIAGELSRCVYNKDDEKHVELSSYLSNVIQEIESDSHENSRGCNEIDALIKLVFKMAFIKHKGFDEEEEYRIVRQSYSTLENNNVKYRAKGNIMVPHIEVKIPRECIKSILIGPIKDQELARVALEEFIENNSNEWTRELKSKKFELAVNTSSIPYRETKTL